MMQLVIRYENIVLTTTTGQRVWYHLYLIFLVHQAGYMVNLSDFYSYRLIGKLTASLQLQEFCQHNQIVDSTTTAARLSLPRYKVGLTLAKAAGLRITLNLDGAPIISRTHTHPSHSQTSRLLTSSLSLGVPVPRTTRCM
jgi:hypothetical protein